MLPHSLLYYAGQAPGDVLAAAITIAFVAIGGGTAGVAIARRLGLGVAAALAGAFAVSVALASVVMLAGSALGLSLLGGATAYLVGGVAVSALSLRLMRGCPRLDPDVPALWLGGLAVMCALIQRPWFKTSADTFYHLAAARSLIERNALVVTDPFHGTAVSVADPSSGVLHTMMAMVSRLTGGDMAWLFPGWTILGAIVLVMSFYALVRRLAGVRWAATAGAAGYLVANQFLDFRAAGYPNRISMALVFFGILMLADVLETPKWTGAVAVVVAAVAVSAVHVGDAEFFFIAAAAIAFWAVADAIIDRVRTGVWSPRNAGAVVGTLLLAGVASAPFVLAKFGVVSSSSMVDTASAVSRLDLFQLGPFVVTRPDRFYDGGIVTFFLVSALAVLAGGWAVLRREKMALVTFALCSLPLLLLLDPPVTTLAVRLSFYNLGRIAALLGFTLFIGIAWALGRPDDDGGRKQALALGAVSLFAAAWISVAYLQTTWTTTVGAVRARMNVSVWSSRGSDIRESWDEATLAQVRAVFGSSAPMIAADPETAYLFSALVNVRVVAVPAPHSPLAVETVSGEARREAMSHLLYPTATLAERRAILRTWNVDYVVLWWTRLAQRDPAASMLMQGDLFEPVVYAPHLLVLRVKR